jgi:hypothetical protein
VEWCFTPEAAKAVYDEDGGWLVEDVISGIHAWLVGPGVEGCYPEDADARTAAALAGMDEDSPDA